MNQAVHAGENLSEGTEGHQLDDLGVHHVAHGILGHELIPGVHLGGLVAQRNLVLLGVEGNDVNVDLVADLHNVSGRLDAVPAQLGNVNHAVHTADIHKCAVGSQGLDGAVVLLAHFDLGPDLLLRSLASLGVDGADGADDTAAGAVDLGNLQLHGLADHTGHVAALGDAGLGSGDEHPDALDVGDQAALVFLGDGAFHSGLVLCPGSHVVPDLQAVQFLLGKLHGAFLVVDANDEDLNLVADFQDVFRLHGRIGADFVIRDVAGMLGAEVDLDFGVADSGHGADNLISCI